MARVSNPTAEHRHSDDAWKALASVVDLIKNVETKAAVTLASSTAIIGLLLNIAKGQSFEQPSLALPLCVSAASSVAAGISAAMTLWPRLYTQDCVRSELFFGHIDQKFGTPREFVDQACALLGDKDRLAREVIGQFWSISCIARRKYRWSKIALAFALVALANLAIAATVVSL
ncbi:Pycsar system effector family protein [Actinoplanes sp. ATCC 53533]|uniref:Pycsar system effector family protein n=1 Tax=Actinoplanes sp. ATCC 53533 TaxID=1288362 RepID=UPI003519D333